MIINDKIGLVLSGGGFKGLAHLGVLHYMNEIKMPLHAISGTSAGALIGAFIAAGFTPYQILEIGKAERVFSYTYFSLKSGGLFSTAILEDIIKKYIPHNSFEALNMPFYATTTDITNGKVLTFNSGDLSLAVKASCSFPLLFQPVPFEDVYLCDGGLLNNFPMEPITATCHLTIGINVNPLNKAEGSFSYKQMLTRIVRIASSRLQDTAKTQCDLYIEPEGIANYNMFDINKSQEIFELGYSYAKARKDDFQQLLDRHQRLGYT